MQCVIPCAGNGTRMGKIPKNMLMVKNKPVLTHIIEQWQPIVDNFVFVIRREQTYLLPLMPNDSAVVFQDEQNGLTDAIYRTYPYIQKDFVIALSDCLTIGKFEKIEIPSIGVCNNVKEMPKNYSVIENKGYVQHLIEKSKVHGALCGMGTYFMNRGLFTFIREHTLHKIGGGDFTEMLQLMVNMGLPIKCNHFKGIYNNINTPQDYLDAERMME